MLRRDALPGGFRRVAGFPDEAAAVLDAFQRVRVRERLGVATEHHVHVVELAIHLDDVGRDREIIIRRRAFLLRAVLRIGHDEQFFLQPAVRVMFGVALLDEVAEFTDDFAEVLAGGDHAPAADGMEPHGDGAVGQQRRRFLADDGIRMVNAQGEIGLAVGGAAPSLRRVWPMANS